MKRLAVLPLLAPMLALAACQGGDDEAARATATEVPKSVAGTSNVKPAVESEYGTPVKDRTATIGLRRDTRRAMRENFRGLPIDSR